MKVRVEEQKNKVFMAIKQRFSRKKKKSDGVTTTQETMPDIPSVELNRKLSKSPSRAEKNIEEINTALKQRSVSADNEVSL